MMRPIQQCLSLALCLFLVVSGSPMFGQVQMQVDLVRFQAADQHVLEVQMYFAGASLTSTPTPDGQWRSSVDLLIYFSRDSQIVQYDHYLLHSPSQPQPGQDFVDVRRFALPEGTFRVDLEAFDPMNTADTLAIYREIQIGSSPPGEAVHLSDPVLLANAYASKETNSLTRNGFYMEPLPHRYYPRTAELLYLYQEVYIAQPETLGDTYRYAYFIEKLSGDQTVQRMQQAITKTRKTRPFDPVLLQMDIRQLPSGNYRLVTEVRDQELNLLNTTHVDFQRSNPYLQQEEAVASSQPNLTEDADSFLIALNEEELTYSLRSIAARVADKDVEVLNAAIKNPSLEAKRHMLFHFFTGMNANRPDKAYEEYMEVVRKVDQKFRSGFGYGFETDRGYILMKYGQPNDIVTVEDEPHAPPYEIWIYDDFPYTGQRNVKFLFYNPNLTPNDFVLLHSTARTERQNPRWEIELYEKAGASGISGTNIQDATGVTDQFYRNARRYFNDF
ncbi:MAG: GWxTD domain-containing protein [Lewinellaceae bacterium]|nr:GWxTD domain-containing protein [Saprospiraceae bacterium]MCB9313847.1 GWxTD domain-containing protein [Lewinellaceae bacterium]